MERHQFFFKTNQMSEASEVELRAKLLEAMQTNSSSCASDVEEKAAAAGDAQFVTDPTGLNSATGEVTNPIIFFLHLRKFSTGLPFC